FVRVLGEDLVLFRDKTGRVGLLADHCSHRGASLLYGRVEERGIACAYHGWLYDCDGNILETPPERNDAIMRSVKHTAYPVQKFIGMYWAYMGPPPAPVIPKYDLWTRKDGTINHLKQPRLDCNWVQTMENSADPVHAMILHQNIIGRDRGPAASTTRGFIDSIESIDFHEVSYGLMKTRTPKKGSPEIHPLIFPNMLRQGNAMQIRVPIDDTHTEDFLVVFTPSEGSSLRTIRRALERAGLEVSVSRSSNAVHVAAVDLVVAVEALSGWQLDLHAEIAERLKAVGSQEQSLRDARAILDEISQMDPDELLLDFPERDKLDPHQIQGVAVASHAKIPGLCLFDEQGLGKTVTTLFAFHRLRELGLVDMMLVLAPKSMAFEWARDTERFFSWTYSVRVAVGSKAEKQQSLRQRADIYVTNFATAVGLFLRLQELLDSKRGRSLLVVDESFFVKNPKALRTQAVRGLRRVAVPVPLPLCVHTLSDLLLRPGPGDRRRGTGAQPVRGGADAALRHRAADVFGEVLVRAPVVPQVSPPHSLPRLRRGHSPRRLRARHHRLPLLEIQERRNFEAVFPRRPDHRSQAPRPGRPSAQYRCRSVSADLGRCR
ncbi:MAG: Rieske 2Fe-2S domain-containing protein, partial [Proteobacteria bacterium]|nr:Rieske 2Fe-2S domain-containing protein [Pseudomonadota bacterium]